MFDLIGSLVGNTSGIVRLQLGHSKVFKFANWMDLLSRGV